jgi:AcrR family transcriptional regulator
MGYPDGMNAAAKTAPKATPVKRAGRRPKSSDPDAPALSRAVVVQCAAALAQKEPITEISMVRLARELGVAPALIHYYVGSRDELLSAVMNFAFKERLESLPPPTGDWRADLEAVARTSHRMHARWPGLATYIATHNRFRLFQKVQPGETDYGLAFFDHVGRILQNGGFAKEQAALAYHLLMLFLVGVGAATAQRQTPAEHGEFIVGYVSKSDPRKWPGAAFLSKPFSKIDDRSTLEGGLELLLDGFASWLAAGPSPAAKSSRRNARKTAAVTD